MRILYLSQYFPPEAGATQTRAYEMARHFVRLGHQVTMIAEVPNHPSGIIQPPFRGKIYKRVYLDGIDVIHVWVKTSPVKNFRNRMLFYLTYMCNAILAGILLARARYDLVYASSPPLFVGGSGLALSWIKRAPLVFEVRDLWPESAIALGEIRNPRAIAWATCLEETCYRRAQAIIVVTQGILDHLVKRGVSEGKLSLVPNGANVDLFRFQPEERLRVRAELGLQDKFVAIYAGIFGIAQNLETLLTAAQHLSNEPDVHFLLVGDGPKKAEMVDLCATLNLPNLTILPEQPRQAIPALLSAADVALIPLKNLEVFKGALPSKMFDAWACERPVLLSVEGEAQQIMERARAGIFAPPEDAIAIAHAILQLKADVPACHEMGLNGRRFTELYYSRQAQAEKVAMLLEGIT